MYAASMNNAQAEQSRILVLDPLCVVQVDTASQMNGTRFITSEISSVLQGAAGEYGFYDAGGAGAYWIRAALTAFSNVSAQTGIHAAAAINHDGALAGVLVYISQVQEIYESLRDIQLKMLLWMGIARRRCWFSAGRGAAHDHRADQRIERRHFPHEPRRPVRARQRARQE